MKETQIPVVSEETSPIRSAKCRERGERGVRTGTPRPSPSLPSYSSPGSVTWAGAGGGHDTGKAAGALSVVQDDCSACAVRVWCVEVLVYAQMRQVDAQPQGACGRRVGGSRGGLRAGCGRRVGEGPVAPRVAARRPCARARRLSATGLYSIRSSPPLNRTIHDEYHRDHPVILQSAPDLATVSTTGSHPRQQQLAAAPLAGRSSSPLRTRRACARRVAAQPQQHAAGRTPRPHC
jgi:hypothetical protein